MPKEKITQTKIEPVSHSKKPMVSKTPAAKQQIQPLTNEEGEVRTLTATDMHLFKPTVEILPGLVSLQKNSRGRPQKAVKSVPKSIRLAPDVAQHFEMMGKGWQTRMNEVLRDLINSHKL